WFDLDRAEGSFLWTKEGRKLIDFTSGWNTTNLGWNHPEIADAMIAQVRRNSYAAMWMAEDAQREYAGMLTSALPEGLTAVGRATGGTEANEMAIKTARVLTGRKQIVGFQQTYHGQSAETLQIGFPAPYIRESVALGTDFTQLDYPQTYRSDCSPEQVLQAFADKLERVLASRQVAAVVTEAGIVTGWGSTYVAVSGYLQVVRALTRQYGSLMILDEVGTGFSRCGRLFGMEMTGVTPDIVTFAKAITNGGAAMGALVTNDEIGQVAADKGIFVSTFGWTPLACAAATQTLRIHQRDKVWEKVCQDGDYVVERLKRELAGHPAVGDIRGKGMEIGIDFVTDRMTRQADTPLKIRIVQRAFENGLHVVGDNESNIQLMPPLTIDRRTLDEGLDILISSIKMS
ncbi:MAG TPA: aspartate aminotransferase family protein, partial [Burkholderiales bacterium]|nr:aspartate aminotransferase family protein [Burkholderiales bacterium]